MTRSRPRPLAHACMRRASACAPSWLLALITVLGSWLAAAPATASVSGDDLAKVEAALQRGAFTEAISQLELWSDQGVVHPDLSFDRGVAYLGRAESPAKRSADLGQAVAAFEEAVWLDPEDEEAASIIERIRARISERRAKHAGEGVVARPRLLRALVGLAGEDVWAGLGLAGALVLTLGLAARLWTRGHRARLSGSIAAAVGLAFAALGAGMACAGQRLRARSTPAVVIVEEARLQDDAGRPPGGARRASTLGEASDRLPEGTLVHISGTRRGLVQIEWGDARAWLDARAVRRLAGAR